MKRLMSVGLLAALAFLWIGNAAAKEMPSSDLLNVQERTLDNGLQVLMIEDHSAPIISYQVYYHVGSRNERPGITGMAHFFEHMMFRGSKKYGPEEHNDIVKAHGGSLNASTWYDRTMYYENISSEYLELIIQLEAEREANLNITEDTFKPEQQVITEERRMRVDNDLFGSAMEQLTTTVWKSSTYHWPVIGWMSDIQNYRLQDLKWFYKTYYAPNNATVVLAGDFDPDHAMELIEKYYGKIPAQDQPYEAKTVEEPQKGERRVYFHRPAALPFLLAGYHVPAASDSDYAAIEVAQKILSAGESSRIYKHCIYDTQIARFAGGSLWQLHNPGIFFAYIGVNAGQEMDDAEEALFSTIEGMADNPPTDRELQKAKNQLEADFYFGLQRVSGKASTVGEAVVTYKDGYKGLFDRLDQYKQVTVEDVQRVVRKYFRPLNRTTVIVVPDNDVDPVDFSEAR